MGRQLLPTLGLMSARNIFNDVESFERRLGLPAGFYVKVLEEDDWSFVIKLNALFEAAATHALIARLHAPEIEDPLANLELADGARGKVKFLSALNCITSEQSSFLRKIAELRNGLVHNVARIGFTFDDYVARMDSNQRAQVVKVFGHAWAETVEIGEHKVPRAKFVIENTKLSIWFAAAEVLACLYLEFEIAELRLQTAVLEGYRKLASEAASNKEGGE